MRHFFITVLGSLIGFFIAMILVIFALVAFAVSTIKSATTQADPVYTNAVLTLDLRKHLRDFGGENSLFGSSSPSIVNIARSLDRAKSDKDVKGVFIRANGWGMEPAKAEELRMALEDFQTSGKFVIVHAQGFEGTSLSAYMAVSGADEIWLQDTTGFSLAGYRAEIEFYGGVFEKFDAKAEFIQFKEYKNAVNSYTKKGLTPAHKESMTALLGSLMDSSVSNIAADREMSEDTVLTFLQDAPHSAEQAKEQGFVDKLGHYASTRDYVKKQAGDDVTFVSISDYGVGTAPNKTGDTLTPVIAVIGGEGAVVTGGSSDGSNPFAGGGLTMGSDTISEALINAAEDATVKAVIFRVNSPGGSAAASDQIWDAVNRVRDEGKPVIISMGQYAASGGYYVAANADKIVAMPTTITGSIGVYGGKFYLADTFAKVGYNIEAVSTGGEFTAAYSAVEPWSQGNRAAMQNSMADIYEDFTTRVAEGRDLPMETVLEIAKGRVWTGAQAKEIGLVDELGGFMTALKVAKDEAGIKEGTQVRLQVFPKPLNELEQLQQLFNASVQMSENLGELRMLADSPEVQALIDARNRLNTDGSARLYAPLPEIK